MVWIRAVILAFSAYSRIPVPQMKRDGSAAKLSIAFLPLVGAAVGGAVWLWANFCRAKEFSPVLFAAVAAALPILITGGIHMDGFCDTADALSAWRGKERALEILKDPRAGAFAVIHFGAYMLVNFALLYELFGRGLGAGFGFVYVVSRGFAAWSAMTFKSAKSDGMLADFTEKNEKKRRAAIKIILVFLTAVGMVCFMLFTAFHGVFGLLICPPAMVLYKKMSLKRFGGITGDTTGWFLQILEIILLAGLLGLS